MSQPTPSSHAAETYKNSVLLPKTDFPMRADLVKREPVRLEKWEKAGLYEAIQTRRKNQAAPRYVLHDGPPFANGLPHYGHLLTGFVKDVVWDRLPPPRRAGATPAGVPR